MVTECAHCKSHDIIAGLDQVQCLHCGKFTYANGNPVVPDPATESVSWFGRRNVDGGQFDSQE